MPGHLCPVCSYPPSPHVPSPWGAPHRDAPEASRGGRAGRRVPRVSAPRRAPRRHDARRGHRPALVLRRARLVDRLPHHRRPPVLVAHQPRDAELFKAAERVELNDPRAQWDGHTTAEKYEHIAAHTADLMASCGPGVRRLSHADRPMRDREEPVTMEPTRVELLVDGGWQPLRGITNVVLYDWPGLARARRTRSRSPPTMTSLTRSYAEAAHPLLEQIGHAFQTMREAQLADDNGKRARRPDRPVWQSPCGPPPRRHLLRRRGALSVSPDQDAPQVLITGPPTHHRSTHDDHHRHPPAHHRPPQARPPRSAPPPEASRSSTPCARSRPPSSTASTRPPRSCSAAPASLRRAPRTVSSGPSTSPRSAARRSNCTSAEVQSTSTAPKAGSPSPTAVAADRVRTRDGRGMTQTPNEQRQELLHQLHEEDVRVRRRLTARLTGWCLLLAALITTRVAARS